MVKQTIKIFCRAKPTRLKTGVNKMKTEVNKRTSNDASHDTLIHGGILSIEEDETLRRSTIEFVVPKDLASGFINNKKESYKFSFEKVFDQQTKQDEIFEHVAKDVVDNVLSGYNGTIFAYGQTGSGKTFTITGGAEKYADRGIIPRVLAYLFEKFDLDKDHIYTTEISYLEIYNENGYDLLDPRHEADKLENLPKVVLMEDTDQCIHLKNLTILPSQSIEEALNLLFLGDTNRMIAETPMNQASTRSHCIFTIHVTSREPGSATIRRSKLHLVDLAGSERVTKTQVGGQLLTEAKYINLSLHFLEQVIVALGEKNRQHVPYRNSMMTSVLRDSLGGNCMTTMIATIAVDKKNIDESISTCRFSQRVALIKNEATLNEELDPKLMIVRLKKEVQSLKDELSLVTGEQRSDTLTQEEMDHLNEIIQHYLKDSDLETTLEVGSDMRKIQYCYQVLKQNIKSKDHIPTPAKDETPDPLNSQRTPRPMTGSGDSMETKRLKEILEQRDNEINILVSMLKKERKRALNAEAQLQKSDMSREGLNTAPNNHTVSTEYNSFAYDSDQPNNGETPPTSKSRLKDPQLSAGRQEAFEVFKENYEHNDTVIDKKELLKQRYGEAKSLGLQVNEARNMMNKLKADMEKMRKQRAIQATMNDSNEDSFEENEREAVIRQQMEDVKTRYKQSFTKLKAMKTEIDHLHHLLDKARVQMQKDFESWWNQQSKRNNARPPSGYSRPPSVQEKHNDIMSFQTKVPLPPHSLRMNEAWRTPPESPNKVIDGKTSGRVKHRLASTSAINPFFPVEHHTSEINEKNDYRMRHNVTKQESDGHSANFIPKMAMNFRNNDTITNRYSNTSASHSAPTHASDSISRYPLRSLSGGPEGVISGSERKIPFTGDSKTDANILAFIKARESLMQKNNSVS